MFYIYLKWRMKKASISLNCNLFRVFFKHNIFKATLEKLMEGQKEKVGKQ